MNQKNIKEYMRALDHIKGFLQSLLDEENKVADFSIEEKDRLSEITELRMLSRSDVWPEAVSQDIICGDAEDDKLSRAAGILQDFFQSELDDKSFLDFGCGEGHIPYVASSMYDVKKAVGYDIKNQDWVHFEKQDNLALTTDWALVKENGPYDLILANDVLDHSLDPVLDLQRIREVKSPQLGKVVLRIHPWTSRHGTHLYKQLNKAYLHLVFTEDELFSMGLKETKTTNLIDPMSYYKKIIKDAGFSIINEEVTTQPLELFFTHNPDILKRIKSKWRNSNNKELASGGPFPREIIEIQFIDFVLI